MAFLLDSTLIWLIAFVYQPQNMTRDHNMHFPKSIQNFTNHIYGDLKEVFFSSAGYLWRNPFYHPVQPTFEG